MYKVFQIVKLMNEFKIFPDNYTYTTIIKGLNKNSLLKASNGNNIIAVITVDYKTLDVTTVPEMQKNHFTTKLEYQLNTEKQTIYDEKVSQGFTCE